MASELTYFSVAPLVDLGNRRDVALRALGWTRMTMPQRSLGYVVVVDRANDRAILRFPACTPYGDVLRCAQVQRGILGRALCSIGDKTLFRRLWSPVEKRIDPNTPEGFLKIVDRVSRGLRGVTADREKEAVERAIASLDVDWPNLTAADRAQVVRAANQALRGLPEVVMPEIRETLRVEAESIIGETRRRSARAFDLAIETAPGALDERVVAFAAESQGNFITDEYGRRERRLSEEARELVAGWLAEGQGRDAISSQLAHHYATSSLRRSRFYWDIIAATFVNRARSWGQVSAYRDAGISRYRIVAVLDEVTTDICRFLHGRTFSVARAIEQFDEVERLRDPTRIKETTPWLAVRRDDRGRRVIVVPGDPPLRAAIVTESAELSGRKDAVGTFEKPASTKALQAAGVGPPPFHGLCRSTTVPA